jgi:polysaccharide biosynthesis/export protein
MKATDNTPRLEEITTDAASGSTPSSRSAKQTGRYSQWLPLTALCLGLSAFVTGCQTADTSASANSVTPTEVLTLQEGDALNIAFPGARSLDSTQQIRRDGRITMPMIGEVMAAGLRPAELESELLRLYASQLVSKEVRVTVVSSSYAVFVSGAVLRPGKISADRPISALEAIMEAGGFDQAKANTKAVVVIRQEAGKTKNYTLNLKEVLDGKQNAPFFLKRSDIVYVPEKFSWF